MKIITPALFKKVEFDKELLAAANENDGKRIRKCLEGGADVNASDSNG